jgi:oxygen-independent coproporphyrinogen-3 oxidase
VTSLYIHVPFCLRKCPYCDFFSLPLNASQLEGFPQLVIAHLEQERHRDRWQGPFSTVFFGGGTPSLLPPRAVGLILQHADRLFGLSRDAEISLEANPGTVTAGKLLGYHGAGINRLSFGVQSLNDRNLARLGRIHSAAEARLAFRWARQAGFDNVGCDLIFALPDQTPQGALADLESILQLGPEHLSCYGLGIEPETPFACQVEAGHMQPATEEVYAESFMLLHERLIAAGFAHYEISNYGRTGRQCLHNLLTWKRQAYLGVGPGAHSFCDRQWGWRGMVPADLTSYRDALAAHRDPVVELETFDRRGAMAETAYLALRCAEGIDEAAFLRRFGIGFAEAFPVAVKRCGPHLICRQGRWRLDLQGWLLFDHLINPFL